MALKDTKRALLSRGIKETTVDALLEARFTLGRLQKCTLDDLAEHISEESAKDVLKKMGRDPEAAGALGVPYMRAYAWALSGKLATEL